MSVRTEWASASAVGVEVTRDYEDAYGSRIDPGGVALLLSADSVLAIEADTVSDLIQLAERIIRACQQIAPETGGTKR